MKTFALILLMIAMPPGYCADVGNVNSSGLIRVGIIDAAKSATLELRGKTNVVDLSSGKQRQFAKTLPLTLSASPQGLKLGDFSVGSSVRITPLEGEDRVRVNNKVYRGSLLARRNDDNSVTVVEELGLEEYLYGVLPAEMGPDWPLEALKAQAVVARTYALYSLKRFADSGFDLSADVRSQAYSGSTQDNPKIIEAVHATTGEVLGWKGQLVHAFFHANCGGRTSPPVWGGDKMRPLDGVHCPYCKNSKDYSWEISFANDKLLAFVHTMGLTAAKKIKSMRVLERNSGARVLLLKISTDAGSKTVDFKDFRNYLGSTLLRSSYIIHIIPHKYSYTFVGRGYGHGVGMCQDGAKEMAKIGRSYKQILKFYYPGAEIDTWQD
jgi:stage II sporulation protein D